MSTTIFNVTESSVVKLKEEIGFEVKLDVQN